MFKKVLVANRGEIALRIIWACQEMGIKTVAVYSEADRDAHHVHCADEAICIGPSRSADSYLKIPNVISAAEVTDADAIHPGYGFLSENSHFAEICDACKIKFIGPPPRILNLMGDKARARETMQKEGVPVIPGSKGVIASEEAAMKLAGEIGYPVILKASGGGGGRGMRIVRTPDEISVAFRTAQNESEKAFGSPHLYLEKYIEGAKHIEVQIAGDEHGNVATLGERECSVQRRHQKLIEEAPSPLLTDRARKKLMKTAYRAARGVGYSNVGTFEFLFDRDGHFYFIEANTRIQVEHPVTETVMGVDLIQEQIKLAAGEKLALPATDMRMRGHAIECRINAEDPDSFMPAPGMINGLSFPGGPGIRIDTAAYSGCVIPPYYDSLVAKVIVAGKTRGDAIAKMRRTLEYTRIDGIRTNISLHLKILADPEFRDGTYTTAFMDRYFPKRDRGATF